jgi:hypothetical protein
MIAWRAAALVCRGSERNGALSAAGFKAAVAGVTALVFAFAPEAETRDDLAWGKAQLQLELVKQLNSVEYEAVKANQVKRW